MSRDDVGVVEGGEEEIGEDVEEGERDEEGWRVWCGEHNSAARAATVVSSSVGVGDGSAVTVPRVVGGSVCAEPVGDGDGGAAVTVSSDGDVS